ncbi:MAG: ABC transporter permease, partial [Kiritimatiellae bacterium]|nr:ABC transporter permease [Kiritimatiellia bacterium]
MNDSIQNSSLRFTYSDNGVMVLHIEGDWILRSGMPDAGIVESELESRNDIKQLVFDISELGEWNSALLAFVVRLDGVCEKRKLKVDYSKLPEGVRGLLALAKAVPERQGARRGGGDKKSIVVTLGEFIIRSTHTFADGLKFVGETIMAVGNMIRGKAVFRKSDFWLALQQCGVDALPIVALISVLVGMILAFLGSVQLKMFGAQIYIADLVGIGMVRVMGAIMTGIIMAGRTGA